MEKKDIKKLATLARLKLSEQELEKFASEIDSIMGHIDTINELSLESIEPLTHISQHLIEHAKKKDQDDDDSSSSNGFVNIFREDTVIDSIGTTKALENAPLVSGQFFQVPLIKES